MDEYTISELVDWLYDIDEAQIRTKLDTWVTCQVADCYGIVETLDGVFEHIFSFEPCENAKDAVRHALDLCENTNVQRRYLDIINDSDEFEKLESDIYEYVLWLEDLI